MCLQALLALLSALGVMLLGGIGALLLLRPGPGGAGYVVLPAKGGGEGLERETRGLMWLCHVGVLRSPVVILDLGLDERGRDTAQRLCRRWPELEIICLQALLRRWQS